MPRKNHPPDQIVTPPPPPPVSSTHIRTRIKSALPRTALITGLATIAAFIALSTLLLTTYERLQHSHNHQHQYLQLPQGSPQPPVTNGYISHGTTLTTLLSHTTNISSHLLGFRSHGAPFLVQVFSGLLYPAPTQALPITPHDHTAYLTKSNIGFGSEP